MRAVRPRWTALVFLAGEKDLAEAMVLSLKMMLSTASPCTIVVQYNPTGSAPRRFTLRNRRFESDGRLCRLGEAVPVDRRVLECFVTSGITENPSDHYLLVLSGHASGVIGRRVDEDGFSPGGTRTLDLGSMFDSIKRTTGRVVDVLGMDACFMSMCEVSWELRNAVRFLVSSEGLTPQYGWPYHRILDLFSNDDLAPERIACAIVAKYLRYRADFDLAGQSVDLSACELDKSAQLARALETLSRLMEARLNEPAFRNALVLSHWKAQSYKSEQYVDLWDFCHLLEEHCEDATVRGACRGVKDSISSPAHGMVRKSIFNGPAYQHSHGLSIYFPWSFVSPAYERFGLAKATGWHRFLTKYVLATRREMRGEPRRTAC